jgi:uncharacterized membrane protein YoaK (UPF0700 family)
MLVVLLAATAGFADAPGYLGRGHVFTANMTGNTILLGLSLGLGQSLAVLRARPPPVSASLLMSGLSAWLFLPRAGRGAAAATPARAAGVGLPSAVLGIYLAAVAGLVESRWLLAAAVLPTAAVALVAVIAFARFHYASLPTAGMHS